MENDICLALAIACPICVFLGFYFRTYTTPKLNATNILVVVLGLIALIFCIDAFRQSVESGFRIGERWHFDLSNGTIPTYLAFFATAITGVFIYKTFEHQRKSTQIAEFENRFFKFIDYHRENVNELEYRDPKTNEEKYWKGNQVFTVIYYDIKNLLDEYIKNLRNKKGKINLLPKDKAEIVDFVYQCVFFGAGKHVADILADNFKNSSCSFEFIHFKRKFAKYCLDGKKAIYYTGHVRRLGHYFRNLYQAIQYVDKQKFLSSKQKYDYVRILRAQMSVYEQAVFFYNSLSKLGDVWEWKHYEQDYPEDFTDREYIFNKLLITKYDLVRNTLNNDGIISKDINIEDFYPLLNLERKNEYDRCAVLPFRNKADSQKICRLCFNEKYIDYETEKGMKYEMKARHRNNTVIKVDCKTSNCVTNSIISS